MNPQAVGEQFLQRYHQLFDTDRAQCAQQFFTDASTLQFEGETLKGLQTIGTKLISLNIPANVKRVVGTKDIQPSALGQNALVIFVTGSYGGQLFQEAFQLVPNQAAPNGMGYYVHNAVFRVSGNNAFNCAPEAQAVSQAFLQHFFKLYDGDRSQLTTLYKEDNASILTHEGNPFQGRKQIVDKLGQLPKVLHNGGSFAVDVQCVNEQDKTAVLFMVMSGQMVIDEAAIEQINKGALTLEKANQIKFAQLFQIVKENNSYYVGNQLFRLNYGS